MKANDSIHSSDEEASLWAARVANGNMTPDERAAFDTWMNSHPSHRSAFAPYDQVNRRIQSHFAAKVTATIDVVAREHILRRRRKRFACLGAIAAILVIGIVFLSIPRKTILSTQIGERRMTSLNDGSTLELNADTELVVQLEPNQRLVHLTRGEALFNISKDPRRPFIVSTPSGNVRVTGTVFNVRAAGPEKCLVAVLEGTVSVTPSTAPDHSTSVSAGKQACIAQDAVAVTSLSEAELQDTVAWRNGQLVLSDTPLAEAIARFSAYHSRPIIVSPAVASLPLGGRFSLSDLDGFLDSIQAILPVKVVRPAGQEIRIIPSTHP